MAASSAFLEMLYEMLAPLGSISARRMFGGAALYCDGRLFALIMNDELFFKVDDVNQPSYAAEGSAPFTYAGKNGPVSMSYWRVPDRLFDDTDDMLAFAQDALRAAARAEAPKRRAEPKAQRTAGKSAPRPRTGQRAIAKKPS